MRCVNFVQRAQSNYSKGMQKKKKLKCFAIFVLFSECTAACIEENPAMPHLALIPIQTSSPERRITSQKEIVAGEERPKYLFIKQHQDSHGMLYIFV